MARVIQKAESKSQIKRQFLLKLLTNGELSDILTALQKAGGDLDASGATTFSAPALQKVGENLWVSQNLKEFELWHIQMGETFGTPMDTSSLSDLLKKINIKCYTSST
jgi:hypothetical protein